MTVERLQDITALLTGDQPFNLTQVDDMVNAYALYFRVYIDEMTDDEKATMVIDRMKFEIRKVLEAKHVDVLAAKDDLETVLGDRSTDIEDAQQALEDAILTVRASLESDLPGEN